MSTSGPWGPYKARDVAMDVPAPLDGAGAPHQGALVSTPSGDWHYMAFIDAYPGGRIPVLAPITWDNEGWPHVVLDGDGGWGKNYPAPVTTTKTVNPVGPYFEAFPWQSRLNPRWEWNHNPDNEAWGLGPDGLTLRTATVCEGLYGASNTLTQRIIGPKSRGTFRLDVSGMFQGDQAGVCAIRDESAYIGIHKDNGAAKLVYVDGISMDPKQNFATVSNGAVRAEGPVIAGNDLWLRAEADITPAFTGETQIRYVTFWYSTDGESFTQLGPNFPMNNEWPFYMGYRFGVFNWATEQLGGSLLVKEFSLEMVG